MFKGLLGFSFRLFSEMVSFSAPLRCACGDFRDRDDHHTIKLFIVKIKKSKTDFYGIYWVGKMRIIQCGMVITISSCSRNYLKIKKSQHNDTIYDIGIRL